jgi:hypothetical protein
MPLDVADTACEESRAHRTLEVGPLDNMFVHHWHVIFKVPGEGKYLVVLTSGRGIKCCMCVCSGL